MAFDVVFLHCFEASTHEAGLLSAMMNCWRATSICAGQERSVSSHFKAVLSTPASKFRLTVPWQLNATYRGASCDVTESSRINTNRPRAGIVLT